MDPFLTAALALLFFTFIARFVNEKAIKKLSDEQKVKIVNLSSSGRIATTAALFVLIALFMANAKFQWLENSLSTLIYILFILSFALVTGIRSYKNLKRHEIPEDYIKSFLLSSALRLTGVVIFMLLLRSSFVN